KGEWRTVQTGSMAPHVSPGDVVLLTPSSDTPDVGDVVAFPDPLQPDRDVLHRVVALDQGGALVTRGDANDVDDPWTVAPSEVIGTEVLSIPRLGFLVSTVASDIGILIFLVLPALLIVFNESKVWYRYIRYGRAAFEEPAKGRHLAGRPRRLRESEA
ncbi:MAG TPA: signal peptidase I, partial [Acidimicrobiia bacterium]|nr:signal peptidase I [Acidimicrobiia bacterium]